MSSEPRKQPYRLGIITSSDTRAGKTHEDESGQLIKEIASKKGYHTESHIVLPDEQNLLEEEMKRLCDEKKVDLILTTGGTGFSPRDIMPEATMNITERAVPGIPEALRQYSMTITKRAMLSRGTAGIRGKTLIINLPGSPKAVKEQLEYLLDEALEHGLSILNGQDSQCAVKN